VNASVNWVGGEDSVSGTLTTASYHSFMHEASSVECCLSSIDEWACGGQDASALGIFP
jgi:hypothetical protein